MHPIFLRDRSTYFPRLHSVSEVTPNCRTPGRRVFRSFYPWRRPGLITTTYLSIQRSDGPSAMLLGISSNIGSHISHLVAPGSRSQPRADEQNGEARYWGGLQVMCLQPPSFCVIYLHFGQGIARLRTKSASLRSSISLLSCAAFLFFSWAVASSSGLSASGLLLPRGPASSWERTYSASSGFMLYSRHVEPVCHLTLSIKQYAPPQREQVTLGSSEPYSWIWPPPQPDSGHQMNR